MATGKILPLAAGLALVLGSCATPRPSYHVGQDEQGDYLTFTVPDHPDFTGYRVGIEAGGETWNW